MSADYCIVTLQELDGRSEYSKGFSAAGIDGLHLLELSAVEMTGTHVPCTTNVCALHMHVCHV